MGYKGISTSRKAMRCRDKNAVSLVNKVVLVCAILLVFSCGTSNGIFLGETFLYQGVSMQLAPSFNITLHRMSTIPLSLRLNSMCQVPTFQLGNFNEATGYQFATTSKKRDVTSPSCTGVQYCDNNGNAGSYDVCPGSQHILVDSSCVNSLWTSTQALVNDATSSVLSASETMSENLINSTINGVSTTLLDELSGLNDTLSGMITSQEATLTQAIVDSSSAITSSTNANLQALSNTMSNKLASLQSATNKQLRDASSQINSLGQSLLNATTALQAAITNSDSILNTRISKLADYIDSSLLTINDNNFASRESLYSILDSLQQLAVQVERLSNFELEGVDISTLLAQWNSMNQSEVFQDPPNNVYNYISVGMMGVYSAPPQNSALVVDSSIDALGTTAYQCYQEGTLPDPTYSEVSYQVTVTSAVSSCQGSSLLSIMLDCVCGNQALLDSIFMSYTDTPPNVNVRINSGQYECEFRGVAGAITAIQTSGTCKPLNFTEISSYSTPIPDTSVYITLASTPDSVLNQVQPDIYTFTAYPPIGLYNWMSQQVLSCKSSAPVSLEYDGLPFAYSTKTYGTNHFIVSHPVFGNLNIHRCEVVPSGSLTYYDDTTTTFGTVDSNGVIINSQSTGNPGLLPIDSFGLNGTSVNLIVSTQQSAESSLNGMSPPIYYYTPDVWCCDPVLFTPVLTVNYSYQCDPLGYNACQSETFGDCGTGQLVLLSSNGNCPQTYGGGYAPLSVMTMYKSPRIYFCSNDRKYAEPYGVELSFCTESNAVLPGAGVEIQTGIMAPGGLYPSDCIFWNSVTGEVPLYQIDSRVTGVAPTLIGSINQNMLAFYYGNGIVVDEMARLYGNGNTGYDCVTYEMDKILHQPTSCLDTDIPTWNISAYFTGRVRSSGVSSLMDYFDITPIPLSADGDMIMNFALKAGIDYEAGYIAPVDVCPPLYVTYQSSPSGPQCVISGWPTLPSPGVTFIVAGIDVSSQETPLSSIPVNDNVSLNVTAYFSGQPTVCNVFQCMASTNTFVAYPVDTFSLELQRPEEYTFLLPPSQDNYTALLFTQVDSLNQRINEVESSIPKSNLSEYINTTVLINLILPNLTTTLNDIQANTQQSLQQLYDSMDEIQNKINSDMNNTLINALNNITAAYQAGLQSLDAVISEFNTTFKVATPDDSGWDLDDLTSGLSSSLLSSVSIGVIALILSIISICLHLLMCFGKCQKGIL